MRELRGIAAGRGIAVGTVARMIESSSAAPPSAAAGDRASESAAAVAALDAVAAELRRRGEAVGGDTYDVLDAQAMMAEDPALRGDVTARTAAGTSAARAVYDAFTAYRDVLATAGEYLAARVPDLDDVRNRAVAACLGVAPPGVPDRSSPYVLVARDLAPADTAVLDLSLVVAIVTAEGGPTSHTAILARERRIPAVVGCPDALSLADGSMVVVDGTTGVVTAEPTDELVASARVAAEARATAAPAVTVTGPGATKDGHAVPLLANVGGPADAEPAVAAGAEGVGLFRTEFTFLAGGAAEPSVEAQAAAYRTVFEAFPGRKVVVRVLDAGADKPLAYLTSDDEPNPALGMRGLRAFQRQPEVLDNQLAAIVAAGAGTTADVWVMVPMVADAAEARWFSERARAAGVRTTGVMVEVPSAALTARSVLAECDFASIGTNDLTQYTMAADRQLGALGRMQDPWHPAVLMLVRATAAAGLELGKPVGVCGEAAGDPVLALVLVGLGISTLSMSPASLADVRAALAATSLDECKELAALALAAPDAASAREAVTAAQSPESREDSGSPERA
ncbi:MAG: ptsP [Frankiales bacterium]|nr:ptsP [Frankiales bacterium]